jgi:phage gpG-like protein
MAAQIQIQNLAAFLASVRDAQRVVRDLTEPLQQIGRDWMRSNETIFALSGPGPWTDLSGSRSGRDAKGRFRSKISGYKAEKLRRWGFVYPILKASGRLERSLTQPGDPGALMEVVNGTELRLGTRVTGRGGANYPAFLHRGTSRMPARPYLEIHQLSVQRWKLILRTFIIGRLTPGAPGAAAAARTGS